MTGVAAPHAAREGETGAIGPTDATGPNAAEPRTRAALGRASRGWYAPRRMNMRWYGIALAVALAGCVGKNPYYLDPDSDGGSSTASGDASTADTNATDTGTTDPGTTTAPGTTTEPATTAETTAAESDSADTGEPGYCGDGVVDVDLDEDCDDGNNLGWDACGPDCKSACGDGELEEPTEVCDEGPGNSDEAGSSCTEVCAPYPALGEPILVDMTARLGLQNVGDESELLCPGIPKGVVGYFEDGVVEIAQVKTVCAAVELTPDKPGHFRLTQTGADMYSSPFGDDPVVKKPLNASCPPDTFMVGATGNASLKGITWIEITCADLLVKPTDAGYELYLGATEKVSDGNPDEGNPAGMITCEAFPGTFVGSIDYYRILTRITGVEFNCMTLDLGW